MVTVSGLASDVNAVLASLSYAANSEFEGAETLNVTATSKDGAAAVSGVSNDASALLACRGTWLRVGD